MELSDGQKYATVFLGSSAIAGIVLGTLVFPFWNFIREDVIEEVEIFSSADGNCYVDTLDGIPKTVENCNLKEGTIVVIKYGGMDYHGQLLSRQMSDYGLYFL